MLRLQITAPGYLVIKLIVVFFQKTNSLCVGYMTKLRIQHMLQTIDQAFIHERIKEVHLLRRIFQHITDHIFQHAFCQHHIIFQISKSHLRLYHPEFCRMTGGIGILSAESRTKGIDIPERLGKGLTI